MIISVFKTTLQERDPLHWLKEALGIHQDILQWNIDFEDCDNVLRVVSKTPMATKVIRILTQNGYDCIELD